MGGMGMGLGTALAGAAGGLGGFMGGKQQKKGQQSANQANLDLFNAQQLHQVDPTNPMMQGAVGAGANFAQGMFENPLQNPLAQLGLGAANGTNPLIQFANSQLGGMQPNPEQQALASSQNALGGMLQGQQGGMQGMFNVGAPGFGPLSFGRQDVQQAPGTNAQQIGAQQVQAPNVGGFSELQFGNAQIGQNPFMQQAANPFGGMGQNNPGQQVIDAQRPIFEQQLQQAQGQLASSTPGRFNSAFANQNIDLNARAMRDFNMFGAQAMQQGQQQQHAEQQTALNFLLGSRGQAADAFGQQQNASLQQQGLAQQGALGARELQQGLQGQQAQLGLQAGIANQQAALQAQQANQSAALQAAGLNQEGINAFNQSSLQAQQLFQSGQLDAQGMQQQLFTELQRLGLDANTAQQQAELQAQQLQQQGQLGAAGLLGDQAGQAGMNAFQRLMGQGQFGMQQQGQMQQALQQLVSGPMAQLLLGGMQFAAPSDLQSVVGPQGMMGGGGQQLGQQNSFQQQVMQNPGMFGAGAGAVQNAMQQFGGGQSPGMMSNGDGAFGGMAHQTVMPDTMTPEQRQMASMMMNGTATKEQLVAARQAMGQPGGFDPRMFFGG